MGSKHRPPRWWLDFDEECAEYNRRSRPPRLTVARVVRKRGVRWLLRRLGIVK